MTDGKTLQKMMAYARRAIEKYNMIGENDIIAVGVSGGKDSLALLCALNGLSKYLPQHFSLVPIVLKTGLPNEDVSPVFELCETMGLTPVCGETDIYEIVFESRKEKCPCSLCANMRRGALHRIAKEHNCTKLALGHHFDDAVETMIMNLFLDGRFDCFRPVTYLSRRDITVIRPMIYAKEKEIARFIRASGIRTVAKNCPADGYTKREEVKKTLAQLEKSDRGIKTKLFGAIEKGIFDVPQEIPEKH